MLSSAWKVWRSWDTWLVFDANGPNGDLFWDPLVIIDDVDRLFVESCWFLLVDDDNFKDDSSEEVEIDPLLNRDLLNVLLWTSIEDLKSTFKSTVFDSFLFTLICTFSEFWRFTPLLGLLSLFSNIPEDKLDINKLFDVDKFPLFCREEVLSFACSMLNDGIQLVHGWLMTVHSECFTVVAPYDELLHCYCSVTTTTSAFHWILEYKSMVCQQKISLFKCKYWISNFLPPCLVSRSLHDRRPFHNNHICFTMVQ